MYGNRVFKRDRSATTKRKLEQAVRQAGLIQDLHGGRMNGVAAEFPIEGAVHFEQDDAHALTSHQQRDDDSGRPTANHAAGCLHAELLYQRIRGGDKKADSDGSVLGKPLVRAVRPPESAGAFIGVHRRLSAALC